MKLRQRNRLDVQFETVPNPAGATMHLRDEKSRTVSLSSFFMKKAFSIGRQGLRVSFKIKKTKELHLSKERRNPEQAFQENHTKRYSGHGIYK